MNWYQYIYALFLSFLAIIDIKPAIAAEGVSLVFLSLANAHCFLDAADRVVCILIQF